jgi:hypothetical protein
MTNQPTAEQSAIQLKNCPFCGTEVAPQWYDAQEWAQCNGCNIGICDHGGFAAWNRRTEQAQGGQCQAQEMGSRKYCNCSVCQGFKMLLADALELERENKELKQALAAHDTQPQAQAQGWTDGEVLKVVTRMYTRGYRSGHHDTVEGQYTDVFHCDQDTYFADEAAEILRDDEPLPPAPAANKAEGGAL